MGKRKRKRKASAGLSPEHLRAISAGQRRTNRRFRHLTTARPQAGWSAHPEFTESLRLLLERERYTLTDVAQMFGLSRERIRQLSEMRGLRPVEKGTRYNIRVWNDTTNRFEAAQFGLLDRAAKVKAFTEKRAQVVERIRKRKEAIILTLRELKRSLRRDPTINEMWNAVNGTPGAPNNPQAPRLIVARYGRPHTSTFKEVWAEIRRLSGTRPRPLGPTGYVKALARAKQRRNKP